MSTIIAVEKNGQTAVAWDHLTMHGSTRNAHATPRAKASRVGDAFVGSAGLAVYYNIFEHYLKTIEPIEFRSELEVFEFFLNFRHLLSDQYTMVNEQYDHDDPTPFADLGAEFLVASRHGLFRVKEILSVTEFRSFCVIGSGAPHAEGALEVLYSQEIGAEEIAATAITVAATYDGATGGDYSVVTL